MTLPLIDIIAGARPNFMKVAPIIHALQRRKDQLRFRLIHTGQHYDQSMSDAFFDQLNIPAPDFNLGVGAGTQASQTANIMIKYEELLLDSPSDCCLVVGDVNSTVACALTAQKMGIRVAHVEGGLRSGDWKMPEEINRLATDAISNWFFTTSSNANDTLSAEGVAKDRVFFVGNTMIDTLLANMEKLSPPAFWNDLHLARKEYVLLTLHRPSNVDDAERFEAILRGLTDTCGDRTIIYPAHPRTHKTLAGFSGLSNSLKIVGPQPYQQFIYLAKHAKCVVTDSGGLTEETTVLGVPCLTLRSSTERPETVEYGTNYLVGTDIRVLQNTLDDLFAGDAKKGTIPEMWDGHTGDRIADTLTRLLKN